jgi:predicted RNA-binding protein
VKCIDFTPILQTNVGKHFIGFNKIFDNITIGHITYRKSKKLIRVSSRDVTIPLPIPSLPY